MTLFPLASWQQVEPYQADRLLVAWGHYLGSCERPFGLQGFVLCLAGEPVSLAVSASTVAPRCAGFERGEVVELARLCSRPDHPELTRVALRLWRVTAAAEWLGAMDHPDLLASRGWTWQVKALVSYSDAVRHVGHVYRLDGWTKVAEVKGSSGGGTWSRKKDAVPRSVWVYHLEERGART